MSRTISRRRKRSRPAYALTALLALGLLAWPALAQDAPPQAEAPAAKQAAKSDSVSSRLGRLEDKVNDLQVTLGTLESFISAKPGVTLPQETQAPPPQAGPDSSALDARIDALETKIGALTSQIEQMGRQMGALEAKLAAAAASPPPAPLAPPPEPPAERQGQAPVPQDSATASAAPRAEPEDFDPSKPRWYGPKPGSDAMAALIDEQGAPKQSDAEPPQSLAALPPADPQTLYQQGYGALLQKDYAGAEAAFRQFLEAYPADALAGDAQYWIGETYYVRGQYKNAADAFLKGYKTYKTSQKAPDTLLKLGMSLAELGQKDAACSTFNELKTKYPEAPEHIEDEAKSWRQKTGC
jgi:tol-pal system protein YbgF